MSRIQPQPASSTPLAPKIQGVPGWVFWVLIAILLLIVSVQLGPKAYHKLSGELDKTVASTADTLGCSTGGYREPKPSGTTRYVVMPRGCWTDIIVRPSTKGRLSPMFLTDIKGKIFIQFGYGKDRWEKAYETDPGDTSVFRGITTMRFRNTGSHPVTVDVIVS